MGCLVLAVSCWALTSNDEVPMEVGISMEIINIWLQYMKSEQGLLFSYLIWSVFSTSTNLHGDANGVHSSC